MLCKLPNMKIVIMKLGFKENNNKKKDCLSANGIELKYLFE